MSLTYEVLYHPDVFSKDLPKISQPIKRRIQRSVETKLKLSPEEFGEPLRRTLKGYWKLRVGDYRIIYKISGTKITILRIGHRREVYEEYNR